MKYQLNNPLGDKDGTKNRNRRVKKHMDGKLKKITTAGITFGKTLKKAQCFLSKYSVLSILIHNPKTL